MKRMRGQHCIVRGIITVLFVTVFIKTNRCMVFLGATWFEKVLSKAHFPNMDIDTGMPTFTVYKVFVAA